MGGWPRPLGTEWEGLRGGYAPEGAGLVPPWEEPRLGSEREDWAGHAHPPGEPRPLSPEWAGRAGGQEEEPRPREWAEPGRGGSASWGDVLEDEWAEPPAGPAPCGLRVGGEWAGLRAPPPRPPPTNHLRVVGWQWGVE